MTTTEAEAVQEAPAPEESEDHSPTEQEVKVINHLLFHKALIGEEQDPARLNAYIEMVKASREGAHLVMVNPFDKAIAIAFQLVMEKHLDPWRMDLVQFTDMYLEHVRKGGEVDLITAGRLIFMAWAVLKLQSDEALLRAEASRHQPEPEPEVDWGDIPSDPWLTDDGEFAFTNAVLHNRQAPIDEKIRHKGDRKVTLFELVEAFEEARQEAEARLILDAKRTEAKRLWAKESKAGVQGAAHKEDLEAEIAEVWQRITRLNGHPIPLKDLHDGTKDDRMKALVSILFLAREYRVDLWQENFPYGTIFVKNATLGKQPEAAEELKARARGGRAGVASPTGEAGTRLELEPARADVKPKPRAKRGPTSKEGKAAVEAIADMPPAAQEEVQDALTQAIKKETAGGDPA